MCDFCKMPVVPRHLITYLMTPKGRATVHSGHCEASALEALEGQGRIVGFPMPPDLVKVDDE